MGNIKGKYMRIAYAYILHIHYYIRIAHMLRTAHTTLVVVRIV